MKKIIWIILIVIIAFVAYKFMPEKEVVDVSNSVSSEGSVLSVNVEGVALDGPALVTIMADDGEKVVAVPSMGINLCAAVENIADVYTLKAGDSVEVRGELDEEGRIVPCEDSAHYLRIK